MMRWISLLALTGCADFDWAIHNGVHCTTVSSDTCEGRGEWDGICTPCEDSYDTQKQYNYFETTLAPGQTVRPIDPATVVAHRIPTSSGDAELDALYVPSHGEVPAYANTTVLFNHGNYAGIEHYMVRIRYLHEAGFHVIAWDYRGYGKTLPVTHPTPEQHLADSREIRAWADTIAPDPSKMLVYANSIGSIAAVEMSLVQPGCATIMEVPFPGFTPVGNSSTGLTIPEGFLSKGLYNTADRIQDYDGPLFVMAGEIDHLFSVDAVQTIFDNAPSEAKDFWVTPNAAHGIGQGGGIPEAGLTPYFDEVRQFLDTHATGCLSQ